MRTLDGGKPARQMGWLVICCALGPMVSAAAAQTNQVMRPFVGKIDFDRDIQPIFAQSCLRCHGPEKPRSHFRLDNRASALQGGNDNTNDVVPGDGRNSLLLNYVARQVTDMEMPPPGKGDPLTPRQIELLRTWINQGAKWSLTNQGPQTVVSLTTFAGGLGVHGNEAKFRELEDTKEGVVGGVENFPWREQINPNEKLTMDGHVQLPNEDYKLNVALDETDFGFIYAGFEQWRKYYDDNGGHSALTIPPEYNLNQDLYLDDGRFWADLGLTLPNRPQIVLGYEYQYRTGNEASLDLGSANGLNLYPASQALDENTHMVKLDISQDFAGWQVADSAHVEFYQDNKTGRESDILFGGPGPDTFVNTQDSYHDVQGMNTLTVDKQIRDWWRVTAGLYYSKLEGSDFFNQTTLIPSFGFANQLGSQSITLRRESEIFSVSSLFTPGEHLNVSVSSQNEWTREEGFGNSVPDIDLGVNTPVGSNEDAFKASQNAGVRYNRIPFTTLFSEGQFQEEDFSEYQAEDPTGFLRQTEAFNLRDDFRAGFDTSPWRWFFLNVQYHNQFSGTEYNNLADVFDGQSIAGTNGYPGFILNRKIEGDGWETKLVLRPASWVSATLTCNLTATDYKSSTDPVFDPGLMELVTPGGAILNGRSRDQTYGLSATITPLRRLYFNGAFTFDDTRLSTADNGDPSVAPYHGDTWTLSTTVTYGLNLKTDLQAGYIFTRADYDQNPDAPVLPYGLDFTRHQLLLGVTRRFSPQVSGALHYEFVQYAEPGAASADNYSAQGVFASISYKWK